MLLLPTYTQLFWMATEPKQDRLALVSDLALVSEKRRIIIMMTSSNGNIFRVTGLLRREFTGHQWIPRTKPSDAELWFFYLPVNQPLSKQWRRMWYETPLRSLWRQHKVSLIKRFHKDMKSIRRGASVHQRSNFYSALLTIVNMRFEKRPSFPWALFNNMEWL